eukprot:NODE_274_length_12130_cov_0.238800.p3 type:complete len:706 gc:universal NODE_274_length_12130_cov_0.238800:8621-6504(-)
MTAFLGAITQTLIQKQSIIKSVTNLLESMPREVTKRLHNNLPYENRDRKRPDRYDKNRNKVSNLRMKIIDECISKCRTRDELNTTRGIFSHVFRPQSYSKLLRDSLIRFSKFQLDHSSIERFGQFADKFNILKGYTAFGDNIEAVNLFSLLVEELLDCHIVVEMEDSRFTGTIFLFNNNQRIIKPVEKWYILLAKILQDIEEEKNIGKYHGEITKNEAYTSGSNSEISIGYILSPYQIRVLKSHHNSLEIMKSSFIVDHAAPQVDPYLKPELSDSDDEILDDAIKFKDDTRTYKHVISGNNNMARVELHNFATSFLKYNDIENYPTISAVVKSQLDVQTDTKPVHYVADSCPYDIVVISNNSNAFCSDRLLHTLCKDFTVNQSIDHLSNLLQSDIQLFKSKIADELQYYPGRVTLKMSTCILNTDNVPVDSYYTSFKPDKSCFQTNPLNDDKFEFYLRDFKFPDLPELNIFYTKPDTIINIYCYDKYQSCNVIIVLDVFDLKFKVLCRESKTHSLVLNNPHAPWNSLLLELEQNKLFPLNKSDMVYYGEFVESIHVDGNKIYFISDDALKVEKIEQVKCKPHLVEGYKNPPDKHEKCRFYLQVTETASFQLMEPIADNLLLHRNQNNLNFPFIPCVATINKPQVKVEVIFDLFSRKLNDVPSFTEPQYEITDAFKFRLDNLEYQISLGYHLLLQAIPLFLSNKKQ